MDRGGAVFKPRTLTSGLFYHINILPTKVNNNTLQTEVRETFGVRPRLPASLTAVRETKHCIQLQNDPTVFLL